MPLKFVDRQVGPRDSQLNTMLEAIGLKSMDELIKQTYPEDILLSKVPDIDSRSESKYLSELKEIANKNKNFRSMIGMGFYGNEVPSVIIRNVFENPCWYTSYTPYQSEISQGRLEALINFQTMLSSLTGFKISNCSLLDDATAAAEAMRMFHDLRSRTDKKAGKNIFFIEENIFPQVLSVIKTRAFGLGIEIVTGSYKDAVKNGFDKMCFGALVQYPAGNGEVNDYTEFCEIAHKSNILIAAYCDLLSLALLKEPTAWGADAAIGTSQRFGLPMGFGGPTAGWMSTSEKYKRNIPGRIIGISQDRLGNEGFRLALQTREQHIKREKATSNVCTATALMAIMSGFYAAYHGQKGIKEIAINSYKYAHITADLLKKNGYRLATDNFFDTIRIEGANIKDIKKKAEAKKINFYYDKDNIQISYDELTDCQEAMKIFDIFGITPKACPGFKFEKANIMPRETEFLTEKVFNSYHSETEMMRYIKKLERKDLSLTHSMTPLGSCTMKLNAATEMMTMSWPEFQNVHPFAPADQTEGSRQVIREEEQDLAKITGLYACSIQPNSGAAGEYASLMTFKNYFKANNMLHKDVMIIPSSAHGTNPASSVMAGFIPTIVGCDENGNINVDELVKLAEENKNHLAGLMITYPSTHGIFETKVRFICETIHKNGGLVFMDGANMNGQCGITCPGFIGADSCHLNLHKTFAMAHGGGGPGVGAIACTKELAKYLPGHPIIYPTHLTINNKLTDPSTFNHMTAVSAAPWGAAMLNTVTHAYNKMLGGEGLKKVTSIAVLSANYMAAKLEPEFKIYYRGDNGRVGHECIVDLQNFKENYGIDANDFAKRLMDYGFHAPTLSFPIHETLMIEPTESESIEEIDRFVEAMKSIKAECEDIKAGRADKEDNVIKMAPHIAQEICANEWKHSYTREQAAFPLEWIKENKFWPTSARIDNGYGDRKLITSVK
ncbi:MAG: aminomethyl-transferring glycine dehydrogenase [Bacteroidales bacterium]